jgi:hypothetical protein
MVNAVMCRALYCYLRLEEVQFSFTSCGAGDVAETATGCVQRLLRDYDYRLAGLRREPRRGAAKEALLQKKGLFPFSGRGSANLKSEAVA